MKGILFEVRCSRGLVFAAGGQGEACAPHGLFYETVTASLSGQFWRRGPGIHQIPVLAEP